MTIRSSFMRAASAGATSLLTLALAAPAALAAGDPEDTPLKLDSAPVREAAQTGGGGFGRALIGLMLVVGLIFGLHWILKQVQASKTARSSGAGLHPLATLPLGQRGALHVVRAGREVVLVGVADGQVVPIRTYSQDEAADAGLIPAHDADAAAPVAAPARKATGSLFMTAALDQLRRRTVRG